MFLSRSGFYASFQVIKFLNNKLLKDPRRQRLFLCFPSTKPALPASVAGSIVPPQPSPRPPGSPWLPAPPPAWSNLPTHPPRPGSAACRTRTRPSWTSWSMTARRLWRTGRSSSTRSTTCRRRSARQRSYGTRWEPPGEGQHPAPPTPGQYTNVHLQELHDPHCLLGTRFQCRHEPLAVICELLYHPSTCLAPPDHSPREGTQCLSPLHIPLHTVGMKQISAN